MTCNFTSLQYFSQIQMMENGIERLYAVEPCLQLKSFYLMESVSGPLDQQPSTEPTELLPLRREAKTKMTVASSIKLPIDFND